MSPIILFDEDHLAPGGPLVLNVNKTGYFSVYKKLILNRVLHTFVEMISCTEFMLRFVSLYFHHTITIISTTSGGASGDYLIFTVDKINNVDLILKSELKTS